MLALLGVEEEPVLELNQFGVSTTPTVWVALCIDFLIDTVRFLVVISE